VCNFPKLRKFEVVSGGIFLALITILSVTSGCKRMPEAQSQQVEMQRAADACKSNGKTLASYKRVGTAVTEFTCE